MQRTKTGYDEYIGRSRYVAGVIMVWLASQAGQTSQILCCDWLPEQQDKDILPFRDKALCLPVIPLNKSLLTKIVR